MAEELVLTGSASRDYGRAALVVVAVLFFYALLLLTDLPAVLPGYPAVIVSFLIWCVVPGWFLQRWLFATDGTGLAEQAAVAFLMSMALSAAPGLLALWQHWSLDTFAVLYAVLSAFATGVAFLFVRKEQAPADRSASPDRPNIPLLAILCLALLVIGTSPLWIGDDMPRDGDDVRYLEYVNKYVNDDLDVSNPIFATRQGGFGRMAINVWVVVQARIADSAGVEPIELLLDFLPPLMTLFMVLAMFVLARGLFHNTTIALLAAAFVLVFAATDLSPHTGYGRNVILRAAQDKMVSTYILLPIALLLGAKFFSRPSMRTYAAAGFAAVALAVVHPMALLYFGFALVFLFAVRLAVDKSAEALRVGLLICAPGVVLGVGFLIRIWLVEGFDGASAGRRLTFLRNLLLTDLPGGLVIGNYHMIVHPLFLLAILVTPLLLLRGKEQIGAQLVVGVTAGTLLLFFFPFASTALSETASDHALWRLPRLIPVPLILGVGAYLAITFVRKRPDAIAAWSLAPVGIVALITVGSIAVQEYAAIPEDGCAPRAMSCWEFYQRVSDQAIVPFAEESVFLGGFEHIKLSDARPRGTELALLEYLRDNAPKGSTVLLPPAISNRYSPAISNRYFRGMLDGVKSIMFLGVPEISVRDVLIEAFYDSTFDELELERDVETVLNDLSVDYVVVPPRTELNDQLRRFGRLDADDFVQELGEPELITFRDPDGDELTAWAFDGQDEERIGGAQFTVPADMDPSRPVLEFVIEVAAVADIVEGASARIVITYLGGSTGETTSVVTDILLPEGTLQGERIIFRRPVGATVEAGTTYSFVISRLPSAPEDTLSQDIWLTGLSVKYWPQAFVPIGESGYLIYER